MPTRRVIKGVLGNFLGTYVSRYSEFDGYLLFGFLAGEIEELHINLLETPNQDSRTPVGVAISTAVSKFRDQCDNAGLELSRVREASLTIGQVPGEVKGTADGRKFSGFNLGFRVLAHMDDRKTYERSRLEFIVPAARFSGRRSARETKSWWWPF